MKRMILFTAFLALSVFYSLPQSTKEYPHRSTDLAEQILDGGTVEYRLNGVLTFAADLGYAYLTRNVVSETGGSREELEQYFDEHGNPARQAEGHYGLRRIYEGDLNTVITYLDAGLRPMINKNGYCMKVREFEKGAVVAEWYKGLDGSPAASTSGVYGRLNEFENDKSKNKPQNREKHR